MDKNLITTSFCMLEWDINPEAALSRMGESAFGIVIGSDRMPVSVITNVDLTRAAEKQADWLTSPQVSLPPAIIIPEETDIAHLPQQRMKAMLRLRPKGVVVVQAQYVAGVIPIAMLAGYGGFPGGASFGTRSGGGGGGGGGSIGDTYVGGVITAPLAVVPCTEDGCGYLNYVPFIDWDNLPDCKNPARPTHPLKPRQ